MNKTEKNWYNFETSFKSLRDELRSYLKNRGIYYELSGCYASYHFEIFCDKKQADDINSFIAASSICGF